MESIDTASPLGKFYYNFMSLPWARARAIVHPLLCRTSRASIGLRSPATLPHRRSPAYYSSPRTNRPALALRTSLAASLTATPAFVSVRNEHCNHPSAPCSSRNYYFFQEKAGPFGHRGPSYAHHRLRNDDNLVVRSRALLKSIRTSHRNISHDAAVRSARGALMWLFLVLLPSRTIHVVVVDPGVGTESSPAVGHGDTLVCCA